MTRWVCFYAMFLAVGCARPVLETSATLSALRSAEVAGANDLPQASLYLQLAREEVVLAEKLNKEGDEDAAKSMLTRAAADAELALLLSHEQSEQEAARLALTNVETLRGQR